MSLGALFSPARLLAAGVVVPLGAVALALVTQHVFGMQPCPWCVLQRLIFVAISLAALIGLVGQWTRLLVVRRLGASLMGLLALGEIATGLLYVEPQAVDLHAALQTVATPLNRLGEAELCPGAQTLAQINAALR